jgi:predicted transcriptional regulator
MECGLLVRSQSTASVLRTIADDKSLVLFTTVALETIDSKNLKSKTKLTRKQYYSRLSRMTRAGLIRRKNGNYILTTFGRVVYESKVTLDIALNNYWKLKAIDSVEISNELPKEEQHKLIETLLDNEDLRAIIIRGFSAQEPEKNGQNYLQSSLLTHRTAR